MSAMKIVHFCVGLGENNGMANTARQFVAEETAAGHDSRLTDDLADGRMVVFPAASAGKMWFNSGTDIRGIAAEFANLFRRSLRAWSEPNAKIPAADKRRKLEAVHQYLSKFSNAGGEYYVRFTVKENIGGKSPRAEVHASVISSIHVYKKTEGAELSIPIKTQAEDSAPFVDNKIALFLGAVNGVK